MRKEENEQDHVDENRPNSCNEYDPFPAKFQDHNSGQGKTLLAPQTPEVGEREHLHVAGGLMWSKVTGATFVSGG